jgi:hypothetical protein
MSSDQRPGWTRTSVRAASACSSLKTVRGSSDLRSRWMFRLRCGSPTFGRSETCSSSRRTDGSFGRALLASVRAAAIASSALRLVVQTEDDNDPRSPSLRRQRLRPDQGLPLTDAAARRLNEKANLLEKIAPADPLNRVFRASFRSRSGVTVVRLSGHSDPFLPLPRRFNARRASSLPAASART